jgi:hypothetical protein
VERFSEKDARIKQKFEAGLDGIKSGQALHPRTSLESTLAAHQSAGKKKAKRRPD